MYTKYEDVVGDVRLKVMMADVKWPITHDIYPGGYEVFYTYTNMNGHGEYTWPDGEYVIGDVWGTYTVTAKVSFWVISHNGKEKLAEWTTTDIYEYITEGGGGDIDVVMRLKSSTSSVGNSIDTVSCQITGDYMVHSYRYRENNNGDILDRKLRVTNLKTGKVFNFTKDDLKIEDVSPLDSNIKRWKLLAGIGII